MLRHERFQAVMAVFMFFRGSINKASQRIWQIFRAGIYDPAICTYYSDSEKSNVGGKAANSMAKFQL